MKQPRISITPELEMKLTEIADKMNLTWQEVGRMAIRIWLQEREKPTR